MSFVDEGGQLQARDKPGSRQTSLKKQNLFKFDSFHCIGQIKSSGII